jgi:pumilio RNA-binding family
MRLAAPTPGQQYHHPKPQFSSPQPHPPLQPITGADLLRKLEIPAAPAQQYHHSQTRPQSYGMGESSTGAGAEQNYGMGESSTVVGYVPPYASSSIYASHFGKHSPRHNAAPAAPTAPKLPGASAGQLDPNPSPVAPPPNPSVTRPRSSSTLSASAELFQPAMPMEDPNLAAYWDDHESVFNPYAPAFQSTLFANPAGYGSWVPAAAPHWYPAPTLAQVRSRLLGRPMEPELLASPVASAHVARLLNDGDEQVRRSVLATFKRDVRCFMESSAQRQAVLLALVRACMWRDDELQDIVIAVYHTNGFLSGVVQHNHGYVAYNHIRKRKDHFVSLFFQFACIGVVDLNRN